MQQLRWGLRAALLIIPFMSGGLAAQTRERYPTVMTDAPVLNSPWSGIQSFGGVASPSSLAAVSPPLVGGFMGPSVIGGGSGDTTRSDRTARMTAGLAAIQARGQSGGRGGQAGGAAVTR
jgi:hypothetical protein